MSGRRSQPSLAIIDVIAGFLDTDALGNEGWSTPQDGADKLTKLLLGSGAIGDLIEQSFQAGQVAERNMQTLRLAAFGPRLAGFPSPAVGKAIAAAAANMPASEKHNLMEGWHDWTIGKQRPAKPPARVAGWDAAKAHAASHAPDNQISRSQSS